METFTIRFNEKWFNINDTIPAPIKLRVIDEPKMIPYFVIHQITGELFVEYIWQYTTEKIESSPVTLNTSHEELVNSISKYLEDELNNNLK